MNKILVIDVETAGGFKNPAVYDIGYKIIDRLGRTYVKRSFIIEEIFYHQKLMRTAYYSEKVPKYLQQIDDGLHDVVPFFVAREYLLNDIKQNDVTVIAAYNAAFDKNALLKTAQRISRQHWFTFFPENLQYWDIWNMFCDTIAQRNTFRKFCIENGFVSEARNLRTSAEVAYKYYSKDPTFEEEHTGLSDVEIEVELLNWILRQKKKVTKEIQPHPWRKVAQAVE